MMGDTYAKVSWYKQKQNNDTSSSEDCGNKKWVDETMGQNCSYCRKVAFYLPLEVLNEYCF